MRTYCINIVFNINRVHRKQQPVCNICAGQGDSRRIYEACLQTIQTYARCNTGRLSLESAAEEDTFHDILLLMELLTNLLSKDFIDLSPPGELALSLLQVYHLLSSILTSYHHTEVRKRCPLNGGSDSA
jgi:hypothetical protein